MVAGPPVPETSEIFTFNATGSRRVASGSYRCAHTAEACLAPLTVSEVCGILHEPCDVRKQWAYLNWFAQST